MEVLFDAVEAVMMRATTTVAVSDPALTVGEPMATENDTLGGGDGAGGTVDDVGVQQLRPQVRFPRHSSKYRGVTKHRRTGRFEGHVWHEGKQLYLGGYHLEVHAARAHDIMALQCRGAGSATLNFDLAQYAEALPTIRRLTEEEVMLVLRRISRHLSAA
jgi:hypothetical protein